MMVTVGIPVYNGERYIRQAVESVLSQTYTDFELIITDDGSNDKTMNILKSINDPRLKILSDGHNRGIAYRLNQQIALSQGCYFFRMDADDLMMPNRLATQVDVLDKNHHVDVVGGQAVVIGEENEILGKRQILPDNFKSGNDYFIGARFIHPTVAGKIEWFRKWRYSDNMSGNEDLDLWIRSNKESEFYDIEEPLLFYRDPYKFRLKTYFFRQKRFWKCLWKLRKYMDSPFFFLYCVARGITAAIFATLLSICGKEERMISHRNIALTAGEENKYSEILSTITK